MGPPSKPTWRRCVSETDDDGAFSGSLRGAGRMRPGHHVRPRSHRHLPSLGRVFARAARCRVRNPFGLFVGALRMTFATGLRPDRHRFYCWDEIDVATYARRLTTPRSAVGTPFWQTLSDAGRRVAVLDVPHSRADAPIDGVQVVKWGCHDRHFGFHTWPPAAAAGIESAFGLHPVLGLDAHTAREFAPTTTRTAPAHCARPKRNGSCSRGCYAGSTQSASSQRRCWPRAGGISSSPSSARATPSATSSGTSTTQAIQGLTQ